MKLSLSTEEKFQQSQLSTLPYWNSMPFIAIVAPNAEDVVPNASIATITRQPVATMPATTREDGGDTVSLGSG